MNKEWLIDVARGKTGFSRRIVNAVYGAVLYALKEKILTSSSVQVHGFGTFYIKKRKSRNDRLLGHLPAVATLRFRPCLKLRADIRKKYETYA